MERWQSSPPEHEPAASSDIARAVESNGGVPLIDDGQYSFNYRDSAVQSWYNTSSASSAGTSVSSDVSGASKRSTPSRPVEPTAYSRPLRKRRINKQRARVRRTSLIGSLLPYQCTFCTEDFKTKQDWQRHEKSLHLPIEQWVCTLHGPQALKLETGLLIDYERSTPAPFGASNTPYGSPTTAYELIKIELDHSIQTHFDLSGKMPDNASMQLEACRIIFASEILDLKINGQDNIFELCPLEAQLWTFIKAKEAIDVTVTNENIQEEASKIVTYMEQISKTPSDVFANWLIKLIHADTRWLRTFRERACSSPSGPALGPESQTSGLSVAYASAPIERPLPLRMETNIAELGRLDPSQLDSSQMETFLLPFEKKTLPNVHLDPTTYHLAQGPDAPPDEAKLFPPARSRMFINSANFFSWLVRDLARDDPWNQTAADNAQ
ncbi:hypothetical protein E8E11_011478 [Didymella keratinophila]|nr:hypothetical protein E8E11_011478 [Didymella keratinophila]